MFIRTLTIDNKPYLPEEVASEHFSFLEGELESNLSFLKGELEHFLFFKFFFFKGELEDFSFLEGELKHSLSLAAAPSSSDEGETSRALEVGSQVGSRLTSFL